MMSHLRDERQRGELRAAGLADKVHAGGIAPMLLRMVQHPPDTNTPTPACQSPSFLP